MTVVDPVTFIGLTADAWAALGTWATVALAVGAVIVARDQLNEARDLRREQAQPYVVAFMEQNPHAPQAVELVIRNFGVTAARDVKITASPPLRRTGDAGGAPESVWLPSVVPVLGPGQEWRTFWDTSPQRASDDALKNEDRYEVRTSYEGVGGQRVNYLSVLDWGAYKGKRWMETKTIHHAAKSLGSLEKLAARWTNGAQGGLAVFTRDGDAADARAAEANREAMQRHEALAERVLRRERRGRATQAESPAEPEAGARADAATEPEASAWPEGSQP